MNFSNFYVLLVGCHCREFIGVASAVRVNRYYVLFCNFTGHLEF